MRQDIKSKILLLLLAGVTLGFTRSSTGYRRVFSLTAKEWKRIDQQKLKSEIKNLYQSHLVEEKINPDGTYTFTLSKKGKLKAITYQFDEMRISQRSWDGKWRIVFFDVPEQHRWGRDSLRDKLKKLGFHELQKSVFVFPYECEDEIDFIIEYYDIRKYVRFGVMDYLDNALHLKSHFKLK